MWARRIRERETMIEMNMRREVGEVPKIAAQIVAGARKGREEKPASVLMRMGTGPRLKVGNGFGCPSRKAWMVSARRNSSPWRSGRVVADRMRRLKSAITTMIVSFFIVSSIAYVTIGL